MTVQGPDAGEQERPKSSPSGGNAVDGRRLADLRRAHGWTQPMLAERAGLSVHVVRKIEQNPHGSALLSTLGALAAALDVPVHSLFAGGEPIAVQAEPTLLRHLMKQRHWRAYKTFEVQFRNAAQDLARRDREPRLAKLTVSLRQFERWYTGDVKTEPQPDACRVLEYMFGHPIDKLLAPHDPGAEPPDGNTEAGPEPYRSDEVSNTLRRDFVMLGGSVVAGNAIENELNRIHMTLSRGSTNDERISSLENCADELGVNAAGIFRPALILRPALAALSNVRGLLDERQPTRYQTRLVAVSAKLSTVVGCKMFDAGQLKQAGEWHKMAQYAARDSGSQYLSDIALRQLALVSIYAGDPVGAIALVKHRLDGSPSPSAALAALWGIRARAYGTLGERDNFKRSVEKARSCLDRSDPAQVGRGVLMFDAAKLAFYETTGAVALNDLDTALMASDRAIDKFGPAEEYEPVLVRLDRASALAKAGEIPEACNAAKAAVLAAPDLHSLGILTFARKFTSELGAVQSPETREWREVLAVVERTALADPDQSGRVL